MKLAFLMSLVCGLAFSQPRTPEKPPIPGNEGGAGGHGLLVKGKPYLMDFVEAGVELNPYVGKASLEGQTFKRVKGAIEPALTDSVEDEVISLVAAKIRDIYAVNQGLAYSLLNAINLLRWHTVSEELFEVHLPTPVLKVSPERIVMLAIRRDLIVRMNRKYLALMDAANIAGLVIHEALYALTQPRPLGTGPGDGKGSPTYLMWDQEGHHARQLTGFLFSKKMLANRAIEEAAKHFFSDQIVVALDEAGSRGRTNFTLELRPATQSPVCKKAFLQARAMNTLDTEKSFSEDACPVATDELYASCKVSASFAIATYRIESSSYKNTGGKSSDFVAVNREKEMVVSGPGGDEPLQLPSRAKCLEYAKQVFAQHSKDQISRSIFD